MRRAVCYSIQRASCSGRRHFAPTTADGARMSLPTSATPMPSASSRRVLPNGSRSCLGHSFSTAPTYDHGPSSDETLHTKPRTRRRPARPDPLIVTPTAAARIQELISRHNETSGMESGNRAVGIRLGTKKRGCNGLSYTLNYAYENHAEEKKSDEGMTITFPDVMAPGHGLKIYVEPMALMNVIGTTMDYEDGEMASEFTFTNPNSKGECGCGESFNV
ncbi:hypothetical protein THAOC_20345 [Thalassiosira oceanica]|uniref:Core domain-containing protein n=1 Tax=Thalassiosira oceanica TaxID=159749 RepID=K0S3J7_THAOC|nr:hypothetical protein THAOC_20345 [Thalassiosira oceanica]|eukprot:EJK59434.1 hypothetical protein THAOC_20345 [Thalassiosira oceanica]